MSSAALRSADSGGLGPGEVPNYTLTSDIAQFCFPSASRDTNRKYAYACSVYFTFLLIGMIGVLKAPKLVVRELPPPPERIVEVLPVVEQPPQVASTQPETMDTRQDAPTDAAPLPVLVAPANTAPFEVPTEGYVAVTRLVSRAEAPPLVARRAPPPPVAEKPMPTVFRRGSGSRPRGSFPEPPFPSGTLRSGQTVELMVVVELAEDGTPATVEIKSTSGIYELDRKVAQHVKSRWKWEEGQAKVWEIPFAFTCK